MKLTLLQFIAFGFVVGWVLGDVGRAPHYEKLMIATIGAFIAGYLNNAHGVVWAKVRGMFTKGDVDG